ncbi:MAG: hypothetical protein M5U26_26085 [Planctomycetota bacterium]|nr:hypothetical protein [Planctomycetota bacterium]
MLRWMILLLALSAWLASLAVVYREYGPTPPSAEALANRQARDAIFADLAPRSRRWTIYLNPKKLAGPHGSSMAASSTRAWPTIGCGSTRKSNAWPRTRGRFRAR